MFAELFSHLRKRRTTPRPRALAALQPLEPRVMLSVVDVGGDVLAHSFTDADGDQVTVTLRGQGTASLDIDDNGNLLSISLTGTNSGSKLDIKVTAGGDGDGTTTVESITGSTLDQLRAPKLRVIGEGIDIDGVPSRISLYSLENGADLSVGNGGKPLRLDLVDALGDAMDDVEIALPAVQFLTITGSVQNLSIEVEGQLKQARMTGAITGLTLQAGSLHQFKVLGDAVSISDSIIAIEGDIHFIDVRGPITDTVILAGAELNNGALLGGSFANATIRQARIRGDMLDSIVGAGVAPGDGLLEDGEILNGGRIQRLIVDGQIIGEDSEHPNPGVYAATIDNIKIAGTNYKGKDAAAEADGVIGTAVIDPLPTPDAALDLTDIEEILARAAARAQQLGVNATISLVDREGNLLAVIRTNYADAPAAATTVDIDAGGQGGLEAIDGIVSTSLIAATKAGTAAFLSTSGNAFTTRTAGYIIQRHFPPGVANQDSGPLFGVQLSSLPTSDINGLPLGLSADPGGVPLYRNGQVVAGIGVEVDGIYTVDPARVGEGKATVEERIAVAGQMGFAPPQRIRADRVLVDGIRLAYARTKPPTARQLGVFDTYDDAVIAGDITELLAPDVSPASKFESTTLTGVLNGKNKSIDGEVPNNALVDFYDDINDQFAFLDGDLNGGEQLTAAEVEQILLQAHSLNAQLRAQIRKDRPQRSQVTVSVVDLNGNVLGVFRTPDAPVFGYDVSVQKARTAAFFSRADAGAELAELDTEVNIAALQGLNFVDPGNNTPFTTHVDAAAAIGVDLDGSVAVADRTGGFLSRPNLPDGIKGAPPGPFSALGNDVFSPFNTGLQTLLIGPKLVDFLTAFNGLGEAAGLAAFKAGALGGGGVVPNDSNGGGLPGKSLNNGMQIFAGSVPLYKNGQLVGAVGVSGDGIEQDDYIAFAGAQGFQEFGAGVKRADQVKIAGGIRLPYVKLPRSPFGGF